MNKIPACKHTAESVQIKNLAPLNLGEGREVLEFHISWILCKFYLRSAQQLSFLFLLLLF